MSESKSQVKPFEISKRMVWEAYLRVKANKGAPGVDGVTIEQYEQNLKNNLFKLWNRLSSGSYFPPPVKAVRDTEGRRQRDPDPRSAHCGRSDRRDGGGHVLGARGGANLPSRLLWLPPGTVGLGRGGHMPGALLEERLGRRSRHSGVLRQRGPLARAQGGSTAHRPEMDPAVCEEVATCTAARAGRHPGRPGSGYPTGFLDLSGVGEPVSALRVRYVAGSGVPGGHVRAVLR